jgi:hypothetical protein
MDALSRCKDKKKFRNVDFGFRNIVIQFEKEKKTPERAIFFKMIFFAKKNHFKKNGSLYPLLAARLFPQALFVTAIVVKYFF